MGCFFHPAPSIPQLETACTAPALFSQSGVVMPNGKTFTFTRCVGVPVVMPELLPRWRACVGVWGQGRSESGRARSPTASDSNEQIAAGSTHLALPHPSAKPRSNTCRRSGRD